jgi:hypothetical protein
MVVLNDGDDDYLISARTSLIAFCSQVHILNAKKFLLKLHKHDSAIGEEELLEGGGS